MAWNEQNSDMKDAAIVKKRKIKNKKTEVVEKNGVKYEMPRLFLASSSLIDSMLLLNFYILLFISLLHFIIYF